MSMEKELNQQIANLSVLYMKLHHFHWYVKGPHFFSLHEKFEELYEETAETMDEFAERLLAIDGSPVSTLKASLELASIEETTEKRTESEMVQAVIDDFNLIISELKKGMEAAEQENDEVTSDMFLGLIGKLEKHNWMLKSFLNL